MPVHEHVHHEHFEELCALAALGQISAEDFAEFQAHLIVCAPARLSTRTILTFSTPSFL